MERLLTTAIPHVFVLDFGVPPSAMRAMARMNVIKTNNPIAMCNLNFHLGIRSGETLSFWRIFILIDTKMLCCI